MSFLSGKSKPNPTNTTAHPAQPVVRRPEPQTAIESTIGANTHIKGTIQGDGGLRVDGRVEGNIDLTGNLVITESAIIRAEVKANNISVAGAVQGNITASRVEILDTGRVWGDLIVKSLTVNEGAYFAGKTVMPDDMKPPQLESLGPEPKALPKAETVVDVTPKESK